VTFLGSKSLAFFLSLSFALSLQALETGNDLKLNPDKYVGKKVSLLGMINPSYEPHKSSNGTGSFYVMETGKNVRESYGKTSRDVFASEGQVVVFVPNDRLSSFVTTFKKKVDGNYRTPGKGYSGIFLQRTDDDEKEEWQRWWYFYDYYKGYYVNLTGDN
jgi:hypothetical protein